METTRAFPAHFTRMNQNFFFRARRVSRRPRDFIMVRKFFKSCGQSLRRPLAATRMGAMSDVDAFAQLMARVRRGDAHAAEELFQQFEVQVRLEVQLRLRDPRLRRLVDDIDVCQSVWLSFFVRARLGEYDVAEPNELLRLLGGMARNKVAAHARRQSADRRDFRRSAGIGDAEKVEARDASPSSVVAGLELARTVRNRLSEEERSIADLRALGRKWTEIAEELGGTADARRVQLQRAAGRVGRELGLEDDDE
jgi:RNA polymerase sigma-70 factor (ECF subfamily)